MCACVCTCVCAACVRSVCVQRVCAACVYGCGCACCVCVLCVHVWACMCVCGVGVCMWCVCSVCMCVRVCASVAAPVCAGCAGVWLCLWLPPGVLPPSAASLRHCIPILHLSLPRHCLVLSSCTHAPRPEPSALRSRCHPLFARPSSSLLPKTLCSRSLTSRKSSWL